MALVPLPADAQLDAMGVPGGIVAQGGLVQLPANAQLDGEATSPEAIAATAQSLAPHTFGQKFMFGAADTGYGALQSLAHLGAAAAPFVTEPTIPTGVSSDQLSAGAKALDQRISNRENTWQTNRVANNETGPEWTRMLGQGVSAVPVMAAMPNASGGFLPGMLSGAAQGTVAAMLQPVTSGNFASQKLGQAATGFLTGAGVGGALGWLTGRPNPTPSDYRNAVNYLRDRDVVPTIGQNIGPRTAGVEDMTSTLNWNVPGAQQKALESFNLGAMNEALQPLGLKYDGPAGRRAFKAVGDIVDRAYDSIKSNISLPVSDNLRTNIGQIINDAATPDASIATTTQKILDKVLYSKIDQNGVLAGDAFKGVESDLGKYAARYAGGTATERAVGEALSNIQGALRDSLEDANPQFAAQLKATNRAYAILARLQDAVPTGNADGIFTPHQLAASVARADNTVRGRAYAQGDALLQQYSDAGLRVFGNKFPNSGTPGRMLSADPLAWPFQIGTSVAAAPFYSQAGSKAAGAAVNGITRVPQLLGPAARVGQKLMPYGAPILLGYTGSP